MEQRREYVEGEAPGNAKLTLFHLLTSLKFFYSFKELEELLHVPSQVLWRYVTLRSMPEKETVNKMLCTIREARLVEKALARISRSGEAWQIYSNPGVLGLAALKISEELKEASKKVDIVVSSPDPRSAALSSILSLYLKAGLCIPSRRLCSGDSVTVAYEAPGGLLDAASLPRACIPRKSRVLVSAASTEEPGIAAAFSIAERRGARILAVAALTGSSESLERLLAAPDAEKPMVIVVLSKNP